MRPRRTPRLFRGVGVPAHTRVMDSWRPVEPTWITPSRTELADLHVLAFREYRDTGSVKAEAMGATAAWIRGGRNAPVTFREEQPVTKALAKVEMWAAVDVDTGDVPLASLCRDLGVSYAPAVATNPVWSLGVEEVLRWLTADPLERRKPPLPLPRRNPDGSVATAEAKVVVELSRPVASVAREFGLNEQTLRNWVNT